MENDTSSREVQLLDELQQFLQSAVHDLRAAQRRTAISAELLLQSSDKEKSELHQQMLQGLAKTDELLAGIGSYATALTPSRYVMTVFPSGRAVRFALANLDRKIRETGAVVNVAELPEITGDRDRISELFEYLIDNSLKFRGPDPPLIAIEAIRVDAYWQFFIRDNGVGIPARYRPRLFLPFRRLQGADIPGAGLGLAISRRIVEAHSGRIWIDPREEKGVTFCFTLPAADGD